VAAAHKALDYAATACPRPLHLRHPGHPPRAGRQESRSSSKWTRDSYSFLLRRPMAVCSKHLQGRNAILTDALNHASVIDGIRLSKAKRYIIKHNDMADLEAQLKTAQGARSGSSPPTARSPWTATSPARKDLRPLRKVRCLSWSTTATCSGFMGKHGKGTHEHCGVMGPRGHHHQHPGKALGGAAAASPLPARKSSRPCVRSPAPTSSPTPSRR